MYIVISQINSYNHTFTITTWSRSHHFGTNISSYGQTWQIIYNIFIIYVARNKLYSYQLCTIKALQFHTAPEWL